MSLRKQRCLLAVAGAAWVVWGFAFAASLMMPVSEHHMRMQYAALAIAILGTLIYAIFAATAPVVSALRAILTTRSCPSCEMNARADLMDSAL